MLKHGFVSRLSPFSPLSGSSRTTGAGPASLLVAMLQSSAFEAWLAWPGIIIGLFLMLASLEFVGRFEEQGWRLAGAIVPMTYIAWSLWLILSGLVLLVG